MYVVVVVVVDHHWIVDIQNLSPHSLRVKKKKVTKEHEGGELEPLVWEICTSMKKEIRDNQIHKY